jgi:hypothetical protein
MRIRRPTSFAGPSNSGRPFHHWNLAEAIVPTCPAGPEDVRIGFESDIAIQAPGGHDQQCAFQLHAGKCRPTNRAKAFTVPRRWQREARDQILPSDPPQSGPRREQVGGVCRARVFATMSAVTKIESLKIPLRLEAHSPTQARTDMHASRVHSPSSSFARFSRQDSPSPDTHRGGAARTDRPSRSGPPVSDQDNDRR